jgi:hypothetical protein
LEQYQIIVTMEDGRRIEVPAIGHLPGEDLYEVAHDLADGHKGNQRFLHIDGGSAFQKLIPMGKIVAIDLLAVEVKEGSADGYARTGKKRLSLVIEEPS